ncbi:Wzz/FepE/Etk N-terminal domain-containing protein [Colwellia chukchiensis]|uniref:Wzz/FepE/Etk N-terminal domain-containing protein n=1 Tax=Colwellia chukchiensis TaxID=641665 RepID=UPI001E2C2797|nr:Wzz/FepE/Etk N-terminal domain-containing protein [Colwellia chukchiensis]
MDKKSHQGTNNSSSAQVEGKNHPEHPHYITYPHHDIGQQLSEDEIDLAELWRALWSGKLIILTISFAFAIAAAVYAIKLPNVYKATTQLAPASEQNSASGLAKMAGQFGGLASLAGINLGNSGTDKTGLALEVLQSRIFIENFINKYQLLVPLMAADYWDAVSNTLILNDEIYNADNNTWLREVKAPKSPQPTSWEAYEAFKNKLSISTSKETGIITISIEHYSPEIAKQWLLWLVDEINTTMREQDKAEAQRSIDYLTEKLEETQLADMQTVFYQLIEEQSKTIMLAEVSLEYVLKTIDPANVPDEKDSPKRALIVVLGGLLGGILSVLIVLIRYFTNKSHSINSQFADIDEAVTLQSAISYGVNAKQESN